MRYQIKNGTVSLQGETVLDHIDFEIRGSEKIALVGKNGAGKTTLLKLIAGELSLDRDDKRFDPGIFSARNTTVGMLRQTTQPEEKDRTVEELLLEFCPSDDPYSKERYDFEKEYDRIFTGFGFDKEEKKKRLGDFSGGEQTKIAMIRLLLARPDVLLLDEPTNHLDMQAVQWLEEYIRDYDRAAVIVSHDRFFLDSVADVVYELAGGRLTRYAGNYSEYRRQREKQRQNQMKSYLAQQQEIERLTALIEKFKHKPKKAAMARSKKKVLERMEKIERPSEDRSHIFTEAITPRVPGSKWVLDADKLRIGYHTDEHCLQEISLRVRRGQKIGIIGANGTGKTTFLKTILGQIPALSGTIQLGNHVEIGYFDQHSAELHSEKRVFDHFHDRHPALTIKEVKTILGNYLFRGADTGEKVDDLSGGEKSRLVLAEILESRPNLLLLDEPTNHMDIPAKETLESAFQAYTGTMLFISHDRYFIKEVADALLIFGAEWRDLVSFWIRPLCGTFAEKTGIRLGRRGRRGGGEYPPHRWTKRSAGENPDAERPLFHRTVLHRLAADPGRRAADESCGCPGAFSGRAAAGLVGWRIGHAGRRLRSTKTDRSHGNAAGMRDRHGNAAAICTRHGNPCSPDAGPPPLAGKI